MATPHRTLRTPAAPAPRPPCPSPSVPPGTGEPPRTAAAVLDELLAGNARYAGGRPRRCGRPAGRVPCAVVVGCVDAPVPPELVFDQPLGELLVSRTAGQVLDEAVLGAVQYGVQELGAPLVLVLGHDRCAAVAATLERLRTGAPVPDHLELLVDEIAPAARRTRGRPGDWAEHTLRAHTAWVRDAIRADPAFAAAHVAAARLDAASGLVSLLP
ncbi:carbonic anhydrase [Streptomyces misionensis]|uniref:Carbonic anhydrase n=1 Tax=Streptomyces misionensis TaxID=67331 RepID=A0A1H4WX87_9ACTN|nr:carbonic anhydrase [Streptomyces misionensis]SFY47353.1 Carbonic anhydrase 2 [Streptomyces sp. F-1]